MKMNCCPHQILKKIMYVNLLHLPISTIIGQITNIPNEMCK
jgi:hypothetical protein